MATRCRALLTLPTRRQVSAISRGRGVVLKTSATNKKEKGKNRRERKEERKDIRVKEAVNLSLCLTKHYAIKTYWGVEVQLHAFLTSAIDGGVWSASHPGRFTPKERAPCTHWIGGLGPRAGVDTVAKKKFPAPVGNRTLEPRSSRP
jgi:hypothetical protein